MAFAFDLEIDIEEMSELGTNSNRMCRYGKNADARAHTFFAMHANDHPCFRHLLPSKLQGAGVS